MTKVCSMKYTCAQNMRTHTQMSASKTGNLNKLGGLYQYQYPGCNTVLYFCETSPLGVIRQKVRGNSACESAVISINISIKNVIRDSNSIKCLVLLFDKTSLSDLTVIDYSTNWDHLP